MLSLSKDDVRMVRELLDVTRKQAGESGRAEFSRLLAGFSARVVYFIDASRTPARHRLSVTCYDGQTAQPLAAAILDLWMMLPVDRIMENWCPALGNTTGEGRVEWTMREIQI